MKKLIFGIAASAVLFLAACTGKTSVTAGSGDSTAAYLKKITAVAMSSDSAFCAKDIAGSMKDYAPGFVDYGSGSGKPEKNLDSMKIGAKAFLDAFADFKGENLHAYAADSTVVITGTFSGTFTKEFMKIKATNKSYKVPDADIFTFNKDGKIISHKSIQGDATVLYQLGVPMPPKKSK